MPHVVGTGECVYQISVTGTGLAGAAALVSTDPVGEDTIRLTYALA